MWEGKFPTFRNPGLNFGWTNIKISLLYCNNNYSGKTSIFLDDIIGKNSEKKKLGDRLPVEATSMVAILKNFFSSGVCQLFWPAVISSS